MNDSGQAADDRPIIAIDPGREKCGLATVSSTGEILGRCILPVAELGEHLKSSLGRSAPSAIVLGNRTGHGPVKETLESLELGIPIQLVEEHNSTLEARSLYFKLNPPRGWRRLLPLSLQTPPVPVDDYAAAVLARRFLSRQCPTTP